MMTIVEPEIVPTPDCEIGEYVLCDEHPKIQNTTGKYIRGSITNKELDKYLQTHIGQITNVFLNEYEVTFYDENFPEEWAKHWFKKTPNPLRADWEDFGFYYSRRFKKVKIVAHSKSKNSIQSIITGKKFGL